MKTLKRTLSLALALMMIFSVVPLSPAVLGFDNDPDAGMPVFATASDAWREAIQGNDDLADDCTLNADPCEDWIAVSVDEDIQPPRNDDIPDPSSLIPDPYEDDDPVGDDETTPPPEAVPPSVEGNDGEDDEMFPLRPPLWIASRLASLAVAKTDVFRHGLPMSGRTFAIYTL